MLKVLIPLLVFVSFACQTQSIRVGVPNIDHSSYSKGNISANVFEHKPLFKCMEDSLQTAIDWQGYPLLRLMKMVENNKLDASFPLIFNQERDKKAHRSEYVNDGVYSWVAIDESVDMADRELDVGAMRGSAQHSKLSALNYKYIYLSDEHSKLFTLLLARKLKVIVISKFILDKFRLEHPDTKLTIKKQFGFQVGFYMSPQYHANNANSFNKAIAECRHLFII